MKNFSLLMFVMVAAARLQAAPKWICSTEAEPWKESTLAALDAASTPGPGAPLKVDATVTYQTIDGFGGCFNELGWQALLALQPDKRDEALKELFDPNGTNFTLGRAPIGANDFSLKSYSLDDSAGDYAMKSFSIEHDRQELIPFMKAAMRYQPKLGVWGVPWCPPAWLKTNGHYKGGFMKQDAASLDAYALYFSKYVQAYRGEGINLYAVMPQNEPKYNNNIYPQCQWSGVELNVFLRDHLIPRLRDDGVQVEVWLGTIVEKDIAVDVDPVLGDPTTNPGIIGVGYQYAGQLAMEATHQKYPDKKLSQTETECYNGKNSWNEAMETFGKIVADTNHFASSYFFWNMILNESGRSTWNWSQDSLLTIDRTKDAIVKNPEFYAMKHFSSQVMPGAKRIDVSGGPFKNVVAFKNPSGSEVVVFANDKDQPMSASIESDGSQFVLNAPARSMNTLIVPK